MATEAEIIASNILASAIEYKRLYDTTKKNEYKVKEQRLRRIAENIKLLVAPGSTSSVSSFNGRTGAVMLTSADVTGALGYTPPTTLDGLNDVTISAPANAQVLTYNSTTGQWENQTPAGGGGGGDMNKSTYDVDNDGVVDSAERTEIIVRNSTGSTLTKGQVVYLSGATGNRPNAVLSKADTEATSSKTIGIVVANINNNSDGYVATNGTLHNLDTSAFTAGDAVWLSATTAGAFTSTVPAEPNHAVFIGYIARSHPTQGRIVLHIQNGYEFDELHGVLLSSPANNDLVVYESATALWKNKSISTIFGGTPLVSVPTLAQVTTAGNTTTNAITVGGLTVATNLIYTDTVNGRVGIGTTSPIEKVDITTSADNQFALVLKSVSGRLNLKPYLNSTYGVLIESTNLAKTAYNPLTLSGSKILMLDGNVIIGATGDSGFKLDVNGTVRTQVSLGGIPNIIHVSNLQTDAGPGGAIAFYTGGQISNASRIVAQRSGSSGQSDIQLETNGVTRLFVSVPGNVAVGTTTAVAKFTVAGSITAASALAQGVYFNNTLVQAAASDVLTAFQITPTFTVNQTLLHDAYWMRFTGAYSPAAYNNPNNNATTVDLANSFTNTFNAIGLRIRHTYSNVQKGYGILLESASFIGIAQTSTTAQNFFAGITSIGSTSTNVNPATLNVINGTNGGIKVGNLGSNSEHLIISHSQAGNTTASIRSTYASNGAVMLIDVAAQGNLRLFGTGNVTVGSATDAGYKLDVNGSTRLNGNLTLGGWVTKSTATSLTFFGNVASGTGDNFIFYDSTGFNTSGTNILNFLRLSSIGAWVTQNSGIGNVLNINPTVSIASNTTSSSIFRGIYYNPSVTILGSGLHRAIETTSGDVIFNGGNVGIGTTTPTDIFHIVNNTNGNKFGRISAGGSDASAAWVAQNDQVDNVVYRVFGSGVSGTQMGIALARSASLLANLGGSGKFLLGTFSNTDFVMGTGNAEKMRIVDSTGNILIATTTDLGNKLEVSGTINATAYKINNVLGYTGILNIPLNPPGMQNVDIQSGIIVNIF
jgi:hypothetical protein